MSGKKSVLYKSEEQMSREALAGFLRDLAGRIETGRVVLTSGSGETELEIPERLELEVEYQLKQKGPGEQKQLELEISWGSGVGGVALA